MAKFDMATEMTNNIIAALEAGEGDGKWARSWNLASGTPFNPASEWYFSGTNRFWLALMHGGGFFATSKQWRKLGAKITDYDLKIGVLRPRTTSYEDSNGKKQFRVIMLEILEKKKRIRKDYNEALLALAEANFAAGDFGRNVMD